MNCQACNVEKDPNVLEFYPFPEDHIVTDRPIKPFFKMDCQPYDFGDANWKKVRVCRHCFHRLEPDMWISREMWESLNPLTPFDQLENL